MGEVVQDSADVVGAPVPRPARQRNALGTARHGAAVLLRQREATVFIVVLLLVLYFWRRTPLFLTHDSLVIISQTAAPWAIIAIGEVLLLICGEMDLSVGFVFTFSPFLMYFLITYYGFPALAAMVVCLLFGLLVGVVNGVLRVVVGVPAFITTLGTGFVLSGITLVTSHAYPELIPASAQGIGRWLGAAGWAEVIWAIILVAVFQIVLTRTRWGLHTIAVGGNPLGAREAGINVARIKIGNFMICSMLGAFVGLQEMFRAQSIDPHSGDYTPMFFAVAAAVLGGTAMTGGSGSIIGAFFGASVLAIVQGGFSLIGISANPLPIIVGGAILVAMIANVQLERFRKAGRLT